MNSRAQLALGALAVLGAAFVVGFVWGQGTRSAVADQTTTTYDGGVLTVRVNAAAAARSGLASIFG